MSANRNEFGKILIVVAVVLGYCGYAIHRMNECARVTNAKFNQSKQVENKKTVLTKTIYWYGDETHNLHFEGVSKT